MRSACLLLTAALVACGGGADDVLGAIKNEIKKVAVSRAQAEVRTVECAARGALQVGDRFECRVPVGDGARIPVRVAMTGDRSYELDWSDFDRWKRDRDGARIETMLAHALRDNWPELPVRGVACPRVEVAPAASLECSVTVNEGARIKVPVTIGADLQVSFEPRGVLTPRRLQALEQEIAARLGGTGRAGTADCSGAPRFAPPFSTFECPVSFADGARGTAMVTVSDWTGTVAWVIR